MALHDLVTLRQALNNAIDVEKPVQALTELRNKIANIKSQVRTLPQEHEEYIDQLVTEYDRIITEISKPIERYSDRLELINLQINTITHELFYNNYELEEFSGSIEVVRTNRKLTTNADIDQDIKQHILLHTNWRYPSLEIGCRDGEWTQYMVAADPLYIMDRFPEFLDNANNQFPEAYQNRLRKYHLTNHDLSALPQGQMAFVFSWGYFNYVSMDTIKQYLKQILNLLKPGGVFMFSYNDGDTPQGAGMAENFAQTYMPKSLLKPLIESFGYEIIGESNYGNQISWIKVKKPGTLETIKAHQVLGEIKARHD